MENTAALFIELGALLFVLSLISRFAARIGQSAISFYMTIGLFLGAGSAIPLNDSMEFLRVGSEIGVVLLLLMVGLEYSPKELLRGVVANRRVGLLDALMNAVPGAIAGWLMGWGLVGSLVIAGVTWVSSSGVVVRLLHDLKRMTNRETPGIISVLVIEDLAMAFYLPVLSAIAVGGAVIDGVISVSIALTLVISIIALTYLYGRFVAKIFSAENQESLLIGVVGLAFLVAGLAIQTQVSAAVGAFLVGISLSGRVAAVAERVLMPMRDFFAAIFFVYFGIQTDIGDIPGVLIPAGLLAIITMGSKFFTGYLAAKKGGIAKPGRWRSGLTLMPRGEFSIILAGLAVANGVDSAILPFAATYMLITVIASPLMVRFTDTKWFKARVKAA